MLFCQIHIVVQDPTRLLSHTECLFINEFIKFCKYLAYISLYN